MKSSKSIQRFTWTFFTLGQVIEIKLIGNFFKTEYKLTNDFPFSKYISRNYKKYIIDLSNVSPLIWFAVIVFASLNYIRVAAIDSLIISLVCNDDPTSRHGSASSFGCPLYSLIVFEGFILFIVLLNIILVIISIVYFEYLKENINKAYTYIEQNIGFCSTIKNTSENEYGIKLFRR
jgi:hypothetical protein